MTLCKDCIYWNRFHPYIDKGICRKITTEADHETWILMWVDNVTALLSTHEDFGCVLGERSGNQRVRMERDE